MFVVYNLLIISAFKSLDDMYKPKNPNTISTASLNPPKSPKNSKIF